MNDLEGKTFAIHTYGCQMNVRDSDKLARRLRSIGLKDAATEEEADVVIVNSCSVREKAEDKAIGKLGLLCATRRTRPERVIGVTGCMANRMGAQIFKLVPRLSFATSPRAAVVIPAIVARCLREQAEGLTEFSVMPDPPEDLAEARRDSATHKSPVQSFVTVLFGCDRYCSYCIVPYVRGHEQSRDPRDILEEVRGEIVRGAKDICLLGQSVMRYGLRGFTWPEDIPSPRGFTEPFPRLLEYICDNAQGLARVRFTSGHPLGVTAELVRAMAELPQVCAHLHLPMQSGSDRILREMNRGYDSAQYLDAVRRLREAMPDISITTDIIVGYPGETEEDFEATRRVMEEAKFDNAFVFKYSPRPGTRSAALADDVTDEQKCQRDQVLLADQDERGARNREQWVGREVEVLVEGPSLRNSARWSGRTEQNGIVVFDPVPGLAIGDLVKVKITSARPQTLYGELPQKE